MEVSGAFSWCLRKSLPDLNVGSALPQSDHYVSCLSGGVGSVFHFVSPGSSGGVTVSVSMASGSGVSETGGDVTSDVSDDREERGGII